MKTGLNFGQALEAVRQGKRIAREGWNGKEMFVFQRPEDHLDVDMIVNKVKSLPQAVKDYYKDGLNTREGEAMVQVKFNAYLCMKTTDGSIANGWSPSQADMLVNDWCIID